MNSNKQSVYLQIVDDVKRKTALGILREGDKLPSCRELAVQMGINPNTVQRAYSTLEDEGFIYTVPKKGVYVNGGNKKAFIADVAREKIAELKRAGISREELNKILDEVYSND